MQRWTAAVACLVAGVVIGMSPLVSGAQGKGTGRVYDPGTVERVAGEVVEVQRVPSPGGGRSHGVHLVMRTTTARRSPCTSVPPGTSTSRT